MPSEPRESEADRQLAEALRRSLISERLDDQARSQQSELVDYYNKTGPRPLSDSRDSHEDENSVGSNMFTSPRATGGGGHNRSISGGSAAAGHVPLTSEQVIAARVRAFNLISRTGSQSPSLGASAGAGGRPPPSPHNPARSNLAPRFNFERENSQGSGQYDAISHAASMEFTPEMSVDEGRGDFRRDGLRLQIPVAYQDPIDYSQPKQVRTRPPSSGTSRSRTDVVVSPPHSQRSGSNDAAEHRASYDPRRTSPAAAQHYANLVNSGVPPRYVVSPPSQSNRSSGRSYHSQQPAAHESPYYSEPLPLEYGASPRYIASPSSQHSGSHHSHHLAVQETPQYYSGPQQDFGASPRYIASPTSQHSGGGSSHHNHHSQYQQQQQPVAQESQYFVDSHPQQDYGASPRYIASPTSQRGDGGGGSHHSQERADVSPRPQNVPALVYPAVQSTQQHQQQYVEPSPRVYVQPQPMYQEPLPLDQVMASPRGHPIPQRILIPATYQDRSVVSPHYKQSPAAYSEGHTSIDTSRSRSRDVCDEHLNNGGGGGGGGYVASTPRNNIRQ
eukprot:gene30028-37178_t